MYVPYLCTYVILQTRIGDSRCCTYIYVGICIYDPSDIIRYLFFANIYQLRLIHMKS
jgi:hypothetical protein